jgi:hypothetical protein
MRSFEVYTDHLKLYDMELESKDKGNALLNVTAVSAGHWLQDQLGPAMGEVSCP